MRDDKRTHVPITGRRKGYLALVLVAILALLMVVASSSAVSGADFTTVNKQVDGNNTCLNNGGTVNCNLYTAKPYVWLNGGPDANGLGPAGYYFFAVLEPGGQPNPNDQGGVPDKNLSDDFDTYTNRAFYVDETGEIVGYEGSHDMYDKGNQYLIRLFPYSDTTNPGGVYIAAICYIGVDGTDYPVDPRDCKYDAFKVREQREFNFQLAGLKYADTDEDGQYADPDFGLEGWEISITGTDPFGNSINETVTTDANGAWSFDSDTYTYGKSDHPENIVLEVCEVQQEDWLQTGNTVDQSIVAGDATVTLGADKCYDIVITVDGIAVISGLNFGNIPLSDLSGGKYYDLNMNGQWDVGEEGINGWPIGYDGKFVVTSGGGIFDLPAVEPGTYVFAEVPGSDGWVQTGNTVNQTTVAGDATVNLANFVYTVELGYAEPSTVDGLYFGNVCKAAVNFGTKGYWHNKNGLNEITDEDIAHVNGLAPYAIPSSYFDAGDEPFDGLFSDGTQVAAAYNNDDLSGEVSAGAGTARAEISHFLVDSNAGGDPREQLAQQLLAFIFNTRHRLSGPDAYIWYGGQSVQASALIADAIAAWQSTDAAWQNDVAQLLDLLNNNNQDGDPPGIFSVAPTVAEAIALCGAPPAP